MNVIVLVNKQIYCHVYCAVTDWWRQIKSTEFSCTLMKIDLFLYIYIYIKSKLLNNSTLFPHCSGEWNSIWICFDLFGLNRERALHEPLVKKKDKKKKRCSTARCYKMYSTVKRTRCQGISILHPVLLYCNNSVSVNYSSPCSERLPCRRCGAHTGGNTFCVFMCCCGDRNKAKWSLKGKKKIKRIM